MVDVKEGRELSDKVKRRMFPQYRDSDLTGACALFVVNCLLLARVVFFYNALVYGRAQNRQILYTSTYAWDFMGNQVCL